MKSEMTQRNLRKMITALVDDLPEKAQQVLCLHYVDELTLEEIAKVLDLPLTEVEKTFHSASNSCLNPIRRSESSSN